MKIMRINVEDVLQIEVSPVNYFRLDDAAVCGEDHIFLASLKTCPGCAGEARILLRKVLGSLKKEEAGGLSDA